MSGFKQFVSDQCVYKKGTGNDQVTQVIVCCWVDDIILARSRDNHVVRNWFDTCITYTKGMHGAPHIFPGFYGEPGDKIDSES